MIFDLPDLSRSRVLQQIVVLRECTSDASGLIESEVSLRLFLFVITLTIVLRELATRLFYIFESATGCNASIRGIIAF